MTYDGRIEAQCVVPAGVSVSATTDMGTQTVTMPAGSYFMTGAGARLPELGGSDERRGRIRNVDRGLAVR